MALNGLQAWKILQDLSNRFDLVLSELDIPCLSVIDLLCNIMSHHIRKHIPVVSKYILVSTSTTSIYNFNFLTNVFSSPVMSFRDSISLVFKCLSEGAVDYLLKPVRKNELQMLWLQIWRRWHSVGCYYEFLTYFVFFFNY